MSLVRILYFRLMAQKIKIPAAFERPCMIYNSVEVVVLYETTAF
jgi:hypothetical protein